jgi:hypothetical protein
MIELGKEYRTREGSPVRLYTVQGANAHHPIVGERLFYADIWHASQWNTQGRYVNDGTEHRFDLIEVKPVRVYERWVNIDKNGLSYSYNTPDDAASFTSRVDRIACLHIRQEYQEGDGL